MKKLFLLLLMLISVGAFAENIESTLTPADAIIIRGTAASELYKMMLQVNPNGVLVNELKCSMRDGEEPECRLIRDERGYEVADPLAKVLWASVPSRFKTVLYKRITCPGRSCMGKKKIGRRYSLSADCSAKITCNLNRSVVN